MIRSLLEDHHVPVVGVVRPQTRDPRRAGQRRIRQQRHATGLHVISRAVFHRTTKRCAFDGFANGLKALVRGMTQFREFARPASTRAFEDHFDFIAGGTTFVRERQGIQQTTQRFFGARLGIRHDDNSSFHGVDELGLSDRPDGIVGAATHLDRPVYAEASAK